MKTIVNKLTLSLISAAIVSAPAAFAGETAHGNSISEALSKSTVKINLRARYEGIDQDGIDKNASALTLKSRITLDTGSYSNFSLGLEVDKVDALVDDYNNKTNVNTDYLVVTDPQGIEVKQAFIKYANLGFSAVVGRNVFYITINVLLVVLAGVKMNKHMMVFVHNIKQMLSQLTIATSKTSIVLLLVI